MKTEIRAIVTRLRFTAADPAYAKLNPLMEDQASIRRRLYTLIDLGLLLEESLIQRASASGAVARTPEPNVDMARTGRTGHPTAEERPILDLGGLDNL